MSREPDTPDNILPDDVPRADVPADVEEHPWFPSGNWVGWFFQGIRFRFEVRMTFRRGRVTAEGYDEQIGKFTYHGRYSVDDGKCYWTKIYFTRPYPDEHVHYTGYNEGRGIFGKWEFLPIPGYPNMPHGAFFLRPEGWPDPTADDELKEQLDLPLEYEDVPFESLEPTHV